MGYLEKVTSHSIVSETFARPRPLLPAGSTPPCKSLQNHPPGCSQHIRRQPFNRVTDVQEQSSAPLLAVLSAERAQVRGIGEPRTRSGLHFDRQQLGTYKHFRVAAGSIEHIEIIERGVAPLPGDECSTKVLFPVCRASVTTTAGIIRLISVRRSRDVEVELYESEEL
jgi:hypothetical protein